MNILLHNSSDKSEHVSTLEDNIITLIQMSLINAEESNAAISSSDLRLCLFNVLHIASAEFNLLDEL